MKRKMAILIAVAGLIFPAATAYATQAQTTTVLYQADPEYELVIPTNTTVPFNVTQTTYGKIRVEKALLDENKCIRVTMNSEGVLKNQEHPRETIPFQILDGDTPFTMHTYSKAGEETDLTISIEQEDWNRAPGGEYTTAITFTIAYVDKE